MRGWSDEERPRRRVGPRRVDEPAHGDEPARRLGGLERVLILVADFPRPHRARRVRALRRVREDRADVAQPGAVEVGRVARPDQVEVEHEPHARRRGEVEDLVPPRPRQAVVVAARAREPVGGKVGVHDFAARLGAAEPQHARRERAGVAAQRGAREVDLEDRRVRAPRRALRARVEVHRHRREAARHNTPHVPVADVNAEALGRAGEREEQDEPSRGERQHHDGARRARRDAPTVVVPSEGRYCMKARPAQMIVRPLTRSSTRGQVRIRAGPEL